MATNLTLYINHSASDNVYGSSGVDWIQVDPNNDEFIFSAGSVDVADGEALPNTSELNRAGVELTGSEIEVPHYFLADDSAGILQEIFLAGDNGRYVFCASFDGATATEPQLEAWDNLDMNSYDIDCLGAGTPNASWYKAICTTDGAPGSASWVGIPLAGSGTSNILLLNSGNGALTSAKDLYFNFHVVIPPSWSTPGAFTPVLAITYTTN
jgi:hypothetical protein